MVDCILKERYWLALQVGCHWQESGYKNYRVFPYGRIESGADGEGTFDHVCGTFETNIFLHMAPLEQSFEECLVLLGRFSFLSVPLELLLSLVVMLRRLVLVVMVQEESLERE